MMKTMDRVKYIESLNNLGDIWQEFEDLVQGMGFEYFIYTVANAMPDAITSPDNFYYFDNMGLHQESVFYDPFLEFCCHSYETTFTGIEFINDYDYLSEQSINLIYRGKKLGMISGIGIPIKLLGSGRYGGFNLGTGLKRAEFEKKILFCKESVQLVCLLVHRHIEKLMDQQGILLPKISLPGLSQKPVAGLATDLNQKLKSLTKRERDILKRIAEGNSRKCCAQALCLSESTISTHIKNIYSKLDVHNRVEASHYFRNLA